MKSKWKVAIVVLLLAAVWMYRGGAKKAPDEKLANHFVGICKIAKANGKSPVKGVKSLFHFLGHHSASMMKEFGDTLVVIERISDDAAHDERARKAGQRIRKPFARCEQDLERFFLAIEADPEATRLMERGSERLGRSLELIFGAEGKRITGRLSDLLLPPADTL